ncbi:MAG: MipA/OmpV family protein [Gammaproteobacteria bacterium]|nr:MipA/OmpV family protein [Gammaproteobacteria bacterium]
MSLNIFRRLIQVVVILAVPVVATAEEADNPGQQARPLWEFAIAGYGLYGPAYPGSADSQGNFLPIPLPIYRGKFLRLGEDTEKPIRGRLFRSDWLRLDLDMDLNFGSNSADIEARIGMPDLDPLIELGPELELKFTRQPLYAGNLYLALQARGAVSLDGFDPSWRGLSFSPELRYIRHFEQAGKRLKLRLTPTFATGEYMQYYYEVGTAFANPQRPAYQASGGYLGTTLGLSLIQPVTDKFEIRSGLRLGLLQGARNHDSPLFTDDTTGSIYVAFIYKFWASKRTTNSAQDF